MIFKSCNRKYHLEKILYSSDDPVGAVELSGLKDVTSRIDQFLKNANLANDRLHLMDSTLEGAKDIFIRCNELAVQASNDVLGVGDREAIALEFDELKELLVSNIQDSGGVLFSLDLNLKHNLFK